MRTTIAARANLELIDQNYARWQQDPASVDPSWAAFFEGFELGNLPQKNGAAAVAVPFVDRRSYESGEAPARERRQFTNSYDELSPQARELAVAVDQYKVSHRRRFITYEEMLDVVKTLGYRQGQG